MRTTARGHEDRNRGKAHAVLDDRKRLENSVMPTGAERSAQSGKGRSRKMQGSGTGGRNARNTARGVQARRTESTGFDTLAVLLTSKADRRRAQ